MCLCRKESRLITKASMIRSFNQGLFYSLVSLSSFATFSTYTGLGNVVTPRKVFTVITIFSVTRIYYFYQVVNCLLGLSDMWVALKRIQVNIFVHACKVSLIVHRNCCYYQNLSIAP